MRRSPPKCLLPRQAYDATHSSGDTPFFRGGSNASPNPETTQADAPKGVLAGLPPSHTRPREPERSDRNAATPAGASFNAPDDSLRVPGDDSHALISTIVSEAHLLSLSKGRYEPLVARYMDTLNVDVEPSKAAQAGMVWVNGKPTRFKYMRDAEIPAFVDRRPSRVGFAGSHQVYDARANGAAPRLHDMPVIAHPSARFALAAPKGKEATLVKKLEAGETVTLSTEYLPSARRIASENGWSVNFHHSGKGMAEIDASEYPEWFDGVIAIADTGKTLSANELSLIDELDHLAPLAIHLVWRPPLLTNDGNEPPAASHEDPAKQARLNAWLDGTHAERIQAMLDERSRRPDTEQLGSSLASQWTDK